MAKDRNYVDPPEGEWECICEDIPCSCESHPTKCKCDDCMLERSFNWWPEED